ncbi:MAG: WavE lipopolysaccharide synthesis family protein [Chloroherpetonaceae bacterium]|nr:WavE lipopolysaccharide synthesis family protein [Chloroherpetonaceae bacterium]MDW8437715.1 WavE lipopolysaccharide synthesis family protein [Chloroherpetonaceae bacterium]
MQIQSQDISVVVQGPIYERLSERSNKPLTQWALESVRAHLPKAEIILSTWKGSDVKGLDYDVLVENDDPGQITGTVHSANLNRQIVSTSNGVKRASRPFCLKMRTDTGLSGAGFANFYGKFKKRLPEYALFEERLVTIDLFSRRPENVPFLYHPSDISQFGSTADMRRLWEIPLIKQGEPRYDEFAPENYVFLKALWRGGFVENPSEEQRFSLKSLRRSELFLINNYVIVDSKDYGIVLTSRLMNLDIVAGATYTHRDWLERYSRYCEEGRAYPKITTQLRSVLSEFIWNENPVKSFVRKMPMYSKVKGRLLKAALSLYESVNRKSATLR